MADFNTGTAEGIPRFRYPANLGSAPFDKFIVFDAMSGRHVVRNQVVVEQKAPDVPVASVALYLPEGSLNTTIAVDYDPNHLGPMVGAGVELFAQAGTDVMGNKGGGGFWESTKAIIDDVTGKLKDAIPSLGEALKAQVTLLAQEAVGEGAVNQLIGQKPNPRTDLLYESQQYRQHELQFMLIPRTLDEAKAIDAVCYFFNFYMLPRYNDQGQSKIGAFMIGFPYEFEITMFSSPDGQTCKPMSHINKIGRSVLRSVSINHAAGGKTAFIKENGEFYPVATQLTLSFQEVRLLARTDDEIKRDAPAFADPRA